MCYSWVGETQSHQNEAACDPAVCRIGSWDSIKPETSHTHPSQGESSLFTSSTQIQTSRQWRQSQQSLAISVLKSHISMSHMPPSLLHQSC